MRLLLDTHVFLWCAMDSGRLPQNVRDAVEDPGNDVYVSSAAAWEIAIKFDLGKLPLPTSPVLWTPSRIEKLGFKELPVSVDHACAVSSLPAHHADPFDRLMIAQAQLEGLTLVTADKAVLTYPVKLLDAR